MRRRSIGTAKPCDACSAQHLRAGDFLAAGPDEYFVAGLGINITFAPNTPGPPLAGPANVEEGSFVDGRWIPGRLPAGDSTGEGQSRDILAPV
jgi:hypothetical protein